MFQYFLKAACLILWVWLFFDLKIFLYNSVIFFECLIPLVTQGLIFSFFFRWGTHLYMSLFPQVGLSVCLSICRAPHFRNHTSCDHQFRYTSGFERKVASQNFSSRVRTKACCSRKTFWVLQSILVNL